MSVVKAYTVDECPPAITNSEFLRHCGTPVVPPAVGGTVYYIQTSNGSGMSTLPANVIGKHTRVSGPGGALVTTPTLVYNFSAMSVTPRILRLYEAEPRKLLFFAIEGGGDHVIWKLDLDGSNFTEIYRTTQEIGGIAVDNRSAGPAPGQQRIYISERGAAFTGKLFTMDIDGGNITNITTGRRFGKELAISPQQDKIMWNNGDTCCVNGYYQYTLSTSAFVCFSHATSYPGGAGGGGGDCLDGVRNEMFHLDAFGTIRSSLAICSATESFDTWRGHTSPASFEDMYYSVLTDELCFGGGPGTIQDAASSGSTQYPVGDNNAASVSIVVDQGGLS